MESARSEGRDRLTAILAGLGAAGVFEAMTLPATQARSAWVASPWREDPYHTALSVAQFVVPVLALVIAARLLLWRAPGGPDRSQQMVRAAGTVTALIGFTLLAEWVAVIDRPPGWSWPTLTWLLIGGLVLTSVVTVVAAGLLLRCRDVGGRSGRWRQDWLGDLALLCRPVPGLRRWVTAVAVERMRRRAMSVFLMASVAAGAALTAAQAVGERLTDPLVIAWFLVAGTAANLAFCVISNAVAGFIARPPRARPRRIAEASVVAGCLALLAAIAFHDVLWHALGTGPLTFPALAVLTLGTGLATCLATAGILVAALHGRRPRGGSVSTRSLPNTFENGDTGERRAHDTTR